MNYYQHLNFGHITSIPLNILLGITALHQIFYWLWFWQLKEYRRDRVCASLATKHDWLKLLTEQFDLRKWFRPKFTGRIILTFVLSALLAIFMVDSLAKTLLVIDLLIHYTSDLNIPWPRLLYFDQALLVSLILTGFLIPFIVVLSVLITTPLFVFTKYLFVSLAKRKMKSFKGTVIGITGSFGKSSTKELLAAVLATKYKIAKTKKNDNSEIGVAKAVLRLKGDEDFFIVEMGAYKMGEIKAICNIVKPKIGIITGLGDQHLALFGSMENIKKAKYELIDALPPDGLRLIAGGGFNLDEVKNIQVLKECVEFDFEETHFRVPLLGKFLITNALAVIKTAKHLGAPLGEISSILSLLDPQTLTGGLKKGINGSTIFDDSYNSSRESFLSALDYLNTAWASAHKIVVTPGMMELGKNAHRDHLDVGGKLKTVDKVFVTNPNFYDELNVSGNGELITDYKLLISKLRQMCREKTIILFENRIPKIVIDRLIYV